MVGGYKLCFPYNLMMRTLDLVGLETQKVEQRLVLKYGFPASRATARTMPYSESKNNSYYCCTQIYLEDVYFE